MDVLERVRQWLSSFPQWEDGALLYIDYLQGVPGMASLCPGGLEVVSSRTDVLGRIQLNCRYQFALYRVGDPAGSGKDAAWLLDFQNWVLEQTALGLAPRFGDDPARETLFAEKAALKDASQPGSGVYTVKLTAKFVKIFE